MPSFPLMMFAAGFGTRMKDLTRDRPKPLIEVAGKPLIDHALDLARNAACSPIVANLHYRADQIATHLEGSDVIVIIEAPDILETGGGLRNALPHLGKGPVVTLNTDAVWAGPSPITLLTDAWDPARMDALLLGVPLDRAVGHQGTGDFTLHDDGQLSRGPGVIYPGVQIIKTDLLQEIAEDAFSLNVIWDLMLTERRLHGIEYPGHWCDVGHPGGITLAENMLDQTDV